MTPSGGVPGTRLNASYQLHVSHKGRHRFPGLFTNTSEHIRFPFLAVGSMRQLLSAH